MILYHLLWEPTDEDGLGELYGLGTGFAWQMPTDLPDDEKIDFETAVEITALEFPPRVAVRRKIY
jgi:hypothetical protein